MTVSRPDAVTPNPLAKFLPGHEELSVTTAADGFTEITADRSRVIEVLRALRDRPELDCNLLLDVCGVDYPKNEQRFEVVYHLTSLDKGHRVRVRVPVDEDDPRVPTAYGIWKAADWFEREAWDLMGIRFDGHPNLRRILTHEAFQGHALRKDYDPEKRWVLTEAETFVPDWVTEPDDDEDQFETQIINIGPSHPATHGTLRIVARLDGEVITRAECEIGYLHRCFEKMSETHGWNEVIPYTDRLNYCSSMINGVGYALGVEQMLGIEAPPRAQVVRVILSEFSRIMDHAVCLGATLVDIGALTNFWYFFQPREEIYTLLESCAGGRLTVSYARIGGLAHDVPGRFRGAGAVPAGIHPEVHQRRRQAGHHQPHLPRPHRGCRRPLGRGGARLGLDGSLSACLRSALRPATGPALSRLRELRVRRPHRLHRRQLRALPRSHGRDAAEPADHRAGDQPSPRRPGHHRRSPRRPAAEAEGLLRDGEP